MVEVDEDECLAFDDNLDSEVDDFAIKEDNRVFMMTVHLVDPHHFVRASSTVSGHLAEASAKNSKPKGFVDIVPTSLHPYANVLNKTAFDFLTMGCNQHGLPESHGHNMIMNVVDSVTKCVHFIPMHSTINAKGAAVLFLKEIWKHHGMPQVVVSDRGPQFIARFTCKKLYKLLVVELAMSMAYHQTDSQMECVNQVLEGYLHTFTS
jgi:hypothetical protein